MVSFVTESSTKPLTCPSPGSGEFTTADADAAATDKEQIKNKSLRGLKTMLQSVVESLTAQWRRVRRTNDQKVAVKQEEH